VNRRPQQRVQGLQEQDAGARSDGTCSAVLWLLVGRAPLRAGLEADVQPTRISGSQEEETGQAGQGKMVTLVQGNELKD
jgi:hypothetical protein